MAAGMRSIVVPALVLTMGTALLPLAGCKIVRNDQRASASASSSAPAASGFDAAGYVDGVWDKQLVPYFSDKATDMGKLIDAIRQDPDKAGQQYGHRADAEGSPWSFPVKGSAKLVSVNTESRAGTLVVEVPTASGPQQVTLQIGPVVKGTAIRDSLPFFSFGTVTNQIEFAQVGRSFNDRAMKQLQAALPKLKQAGDTVEFVGAISITGQTENFMVTPVSLKPAAGGAS
jgi:predicted lipoprotein